MERKSPLEVCGHVLKVQTVNMVISVSIFPAKFSYRSADIYGGALHLMCPVRQCDDMA